MITESTGYGWRVAVNGDQSASAPARKTPTDRGGYSYSRATIVASPANRGRDGLCEANQIRKAGAGAKSLVAGKPFKSWDVASPRPCIFRNSRGRQKRPNPGGIFGGPRPGPFSSIK